MIPQTLIVVDTSAWIEYLMASALGNRLTQSFPEKSHCIVPTMVQLELMKWMVREVSEDAADLVIAYTQKCQVITLDTSLALLASDMHSEHKLATADAIVYATAHSHGAKRLTCDAHFANLPNVIFHPK